MPTTRAEVDIAGELALTADVTGAVTGSTGEGDFAYAAADADEGDALGVLLPAAGVGDLVGAFIRGNAGIGWIFLSLTNVSTNPCSTW